MRKRARIDGNHVDIVNELRSLGASVCSLASVGSGCPDILVGWKGRNYLFEIKDPKQKPSKQTLTDDEKCFHFLWHGQVDVITSTEQATARFKVDDHDRYLKGIEDEKAFQKAWG